MDNEELQKKTEEVLEAELQRLKKSTDRQFLIASTIIGIIVFTPVATGLWAAIVRQGESVTIREKKEAAEKEAFDRKEAYKVNLLERLEFDTDIKNEALIYLIKNN